MASIKKKKKKITKRKKMRYLRGAIQLFFFIYAPAIYSSAFSGVKEIFKNFAAGKAIALSSFVTTLVIVCIYTIVFGRFFCGYGCAFGTFGDAIYAVSSYIQKKTKKRLPKIPDKAYPILQYLKYLVLFAIIILCVTGQYDAIIRGRNPWDVFSMLTSGHLKLAGYEIAGVILILIVILMAWGERFFCQFLCPMGAVFSLLPVIPLSLFDRNRDNCLPKCSACQKNCPVRMDIKGDSAKSGECIQCDTCKNACPKSNTHRPIEFHPAAGIIFFIIKVGILFGIAFYLLG